MKLPLLLTLPILVFGFELNFTKEFSKELIPDELTTNIKVVVQNEEEKEVISSLNQYNKFIKKYDEIDKSNVSMAITPKYTYKNGQSIFMGYNGILNYTISSKESSKIKEFLENFYSIKEENTTSLLMPTLQWKINDKLYEKALDQLRLDAIMWGNTYSQELSTKMNKRCSLKNITVNANYARPVMYANEARTLKSNKIEMPIVEQVNETITINPNFTMECQ